MSVFHQALRRSDKAFILTPNLSTVRLRLGHWLFDNKVKHPEKKSETWHVSATGGACVEIQLALQQLVGKAITCGKK